MKKGKEETKNKSSMIKSKSKKYDLTEKNMQKAWEFTLSKSLKSKSDVRKTAKSKKKKQVSIPAKKTTTSRSTKDKLEKSPKKEKGRGLGRRKKQEQLLIEYFYDSLYSDKYEHVDKITYRFPIYTKYDDGTLFPIAIGLVRPCNLLVKSIVNPNGFQPHEKLEDLTISITDIIVFEDDYYPHETINHKIVKDCKSKVIIFYNKEQIDDYLEKVKRMEY